MESSDVRRRFGLSSQRTRTERASSVRESSLADRIWLGVICASVHVAIVAYQKRQEEGKPVSDEPSKSYQRYSVIGISGRWQTRLPVYGARVC